MKSAKSVWFVFWGLGVGLLSVSVDKLSAQAEPAPLFAPILPEIRQQLPQGLQMRLPATLPDRPEPLYPFVRSNPQGLLVYLSTDSECNQPQCSVGGAAVFTEEGFADWQRKLEDAEPLSLPDNIQGYFLQLGEDDEADNYILWQQEGSNYVIGVDNRTLSRQELIDVAASMVSQPPI